MSDNTNTEVNSTTTVNVLRLSKFVLDSVATRELPKAVSRPWTRQPTVLMKLDIEGTKVVFLTNIQSIVKSFGNGWLTDCVTVHFWDGLLNILRVILGT